MKEKRQISVNLDDRSLDKLDKLCHKLDMSRAQVLRMVFSANEKSTMLIFKSLMEVDEIV